MDVKKLISDLIERGADFTVYTDIAYGRGINGVGYDAYSQHSTIGESNNPKTEIYRTFEPKDDYLVVIEEVVPPKIPWNRAAERDPYTRKKYIGYERITYINETIE